MLNTPQGQHLDLVTLDTAEFDLERTLNSGQAFHWVRHGKGYAGCIGGAPCHIEQHSGRLFVTREAASVARIYFALDHDLSSIYATFPDDPIMTDALRFSRGMRILRQPPWECLATFITSALKQVAHICSISHALRNRYGQPRATPWGAPLHAYPPPERIAALSEADLRECKLGFRAKNLLGTARAIADGRIDLDALRALSTAQVRDSLCALPGVGPKIADCVLLFAYSRLEAFPVDVWIERVLRKAYFKGKRRVTTARLRKFSATYFGPFGGYAQQYLFHHARLTRGASLVS